MPSYNYVHRSRVFLRTVTTQDAWDDDRTILLHLGPGLGAGTDHDEFICLQHEHLLRRLVLPALPGCGPVCVPVLLGPGSEIPQQATGGGG